MKSLNRLLLLLTIVTLALSGCDFLTDFKDKDYSTEESINGSGNLITVTEPYSSFNTIEASHSFDLVITQGNVFSVEIEFDDNLVDYLITGKEGNKLTLGLRGGNSYNNITLRANITMPDISLARLSGASSINFPDMVLDHSLKLELSGASKVTGNLTVEDVEFQLAGASYMNLNGTAHNLTVYGSGASRLDFENFEVNDASLYLSGASLSTIYAHGILSAYLSGASGLFIKGNPTIGTIETSGGAFIERM